MTPIHPNSNIHGTTSINAYIYMQLGSTETEPKSGQDGARADLVFQNGGNELRYHHTEILYPHLYPLHIFLFSKGPILYFEPFPNSF